MSRPFSDPLGEIRLPGGGLQAPSFFGSAGDLFGTYHGPAAPPRGAVLLCPAFGHEYVRSHRAYRHLAGRLARQGRAVLRFDLFATGDSAGEDLEASLERWCRDVAEAAEALRERSGVARPTLLGRRLGAALAVLHGCAGGDVENLVLWDPVVNGGSYLEDVEAAHLEFVTSPRGRYLGALEEVEERMVDKGFVERLGQRLSPELADEIAALDLRRLDDAPAARVLVLETRESPEPAALADRLGELGTTVERRAVPDPHGWTIDDPLQQIVPNPVLAEIVDWIEGGPDR